MADEWTLTARWIFPGTSPPLPSGTVTVCNGLISAVEPAKTRHANIDLGNVAVIPGLVNAHTHLDLSGLRGQVPPSADVIGWLKQIIAYRQQVTQERTLEDAQNGLAESLRFGTTLIGDTASVGISWHMLAGAKCRAVVFYELLGLHHHRVMPVWTQALQWLEEHEDTPSCRSAFSPHAPYSVHHALFRAAGRLGLPLSIHLAESIDERQLLEHHRGPFVPFLKQLGVWDADALAPSHDWITWRSEDAASLLLAHGNYFCPQMKIPPNATVVYCPRTHAAFGHTEHPFRELLARGIPVALGTDSLASNPDLDVLAEAKFIHERYPDFDGAALLRMATQTGATALGFGAVTGSLEVGKSADMTVIPLPDADADPFELLFRLDFASKPRKAIWRGEWR